MEERVSPPVPEEQKSEEQVVDHLRCSLCTELDNGIRAANTPEEKNATGKAKENHIIFQNSYRSNYSRSVFNCLRNRVYDLVRHADASGGDGTVWCPCHKDNVTREPPGKPTFKNAGYSCNYHGQHIIASSVRIRS